jgi:hypothetical protein
MRPQEVQRGTTVLASCNAPWSTWRRCEEGELTPWQIWNDAEEEWRNTEAWPLLVLPYPTVDDHPSVHKVRMHLPATTVCACGMPGGQHKIRCTGRDGQPGLPATTDED